MQIPLCCSTSADGGSPSGWIDYVGQAIRTSVNYLPAQVSEVLTQSRDYAVAKLPASGVKNMCAIATYVWLHTVNIINIIFYIIIIIKTLVLLTLEGDTDRA